MIPSHRYRRSDAQLSLLGCLILSLGFLTPASASDQDSVRRHSLILRPGAAQNHSEQSGTIPFSSPATVQTGQQPTRPAVEHPTTQSTTPTLHRKLTKRPIQSSTPAASASLQPLSGGGQQTLPPVQPAPVGHAVAATSSTPQATVPTQTTASFAGVSSTRSAAVSATPVPSGVAPQTPSSSAVPAQPLAAIGLGSSSARNGGSRAALSLFKVPAIMNLLQAPLPPLVTPPSNPPATPPSTTPTPPPSTPPSTPPVTPPPSTTPPPPVSTTGSATLSWILGSEPDLAGYKIYVGTSSGVYDYPGSPFTVGKVTSYTFNDLPKGQTYFFALSADDNAGNDSPLSAEVSKSIF